RITGLDPAGPLFFPPIRARNIDKSDAKFVQIIHTNMGTLGDTTKDGHADFYPNGGVQQPNCAAGDTASPNTLGRCSHWYAYQLYAASITRDFPACPCNPFRLAYPLGLCSASCKTPITLGFNCPSTASGEFYAKTTNPI
ncbi:Lipase member H, partial [Orchesella cincta]